MAGLREIAQSVGVSVSTVSKALNNATDINEETREKILRVAEEKGYASVRAPVGNDFNNQTVGIICPEIKSNYYAQILSTLEGNASKNGYYTSVAFTNFLYENEVKALNNFIRQKMAGIILITEGNAIGRDLINLSKKNTGTLIVIAFDIKNAEYDNLLIDDSIGIEMAVDHLMELGHTDIGFISDSFTLNRLAYFRNIMESRGLAVNEKHIYVEEYGKRFEICGYAGAAEIIDRGAGLSALIAGYDDIAIGAIRLFNERGMRVPDDISVIGIDDISVNPYLPVSLTTVAAPVEEMADIATKILMRKLRNPEYKVVQQVFLIFARKQQYKSIPGKMYEGIPGQIRLNNILYHVLAHGVNGKHCVFHIR